MSFGVAFHAGRAGSARTVTAVSLAQSLIRRGRRVVYIDLDLDGPGPSSFGLPMPTGEGAGHLPGFLDYALAWQRRADDAAVGDDDAPRASPPSLAPFVHACPTAGGDAPLWLLPARARLGADGPPRRAAQRPGREDDNAPR
ncbi:MAG: hypothetical protein AAF772_13100, partial [Acidobacteriota bacterium]